MSDEDDAQQLKETVDVGSGDFQPNPIYGDAPPSYADGSTYDNDPNIQQQPQDDNYEYPANDQQQYEQEQNENEDEEDDVNNPFNQQSQQNHNQEQEEHEQYENDTQQNPPPPYSQDPPAPPPAYAQQNEDNQQQQQYDNEPEDVVGQMNADEDVGDYGVTQPKVSDDMNGDTDTENGLGLFGNYFIRTVYMAGSLFVCSMMAFAMWFQSVDGDFSAGYGLSGFAAFMLFLGSIMSIGFAVMKKLGRPIPAESIVLWVVIGFYVTGGLFYFLGGCAVAYAWNEFDASYIAGIFFAEQTFVGLHGIVAGVDLWKKEILNNKKWRVIIYNAAFLTLAVIAFFAYAVTSTKFDEFGADNAGPAFLALFYFLILIPEILYLVIFLIPKLSEMLGKPIVLLILAGSYWIFAVCLLIGYFIIVGEFFLFTGRAYWLGVGFYVLLMATVIAFDMLFDRFIPGYKDGGVSVSDQAVNGGGGSAVATQDPDSPDYE